ncbi:MAG: hypothetical protein WBY75_10820, partial [Terracidiphilus sp.]
MKATSNATKSKVKKESAQRWSNRSTLEDLMTAIKTRMRRDKYKMLMTAAAHSRCRSDAQGQRDHNCRSKPRCFPQSPHRVAQVRQHTFPPSTGFNDLF